MRQHLANWAGADLTRINGLGLDSVMKIWSEIGTDLERFESAHKLARMVYFMLTRGETFVDQGQQRYEQQRERSIAALKRRATALGFQINPIGAAA